MDFSMHLFANFKLFPPTCYGVSGNLGNLKNKLEIFRNRNVSKIFELDEIDMGHKAKRQL